MTNARFRASLLTVTLQNPSQIFRRLLARVPTRPRRAKGVPARRRRRWLLWLIGVPLVLGIVLCITYGIWASTYDLELVKQMRERSTVLDLDGRLYSRLQGENRIVIAGSEVNNYFIDALLAREDSRFYSHRGVDPIGIVRALIRNIKGGSAREGASTLTQQLARNAFPLGGKNVHRKLLEAFVANRIEQRYSKAEILEHYMNRIYFGAGLYGIETAAQVYFGKPAKNLTLGESALIAGLIRSPSRFSPFNHYKAALLQRNDVLNQMVRRGSIKQAEADAARSAPVNVSKKRVLGTQENYAMDAVFRDLEILLSDDQRAEGGLKIYTTLDPRLQAAAQTAVETHLRKVESRPGYTHPRRADFSEQARKDELQTPYLQGAVVVIDNKSGGIRALVGGRDYGESKYNRALMAKRQIGSTFKPFVYAAAYGREVLPGALIDDGRIESGEIRGAEDWTPDNSDGTYKGLLRAEEGLIQSRNTMSVRVGERAGLAEVVRVAGRAGLDDIPDKPAIYLGAFEATLAELTSAYTTFPNGGTRRQSYIVERIDDTAGEVIYRAAHVQAPAIDSGVSWLVNNTLAKVFERGTAASAKAQGWNRPAAGKTGTTNEYRDAWFMGYTSSLTCGVWVGLDKPETIVAKGYGSALALPIWTDTMLAAPIQRYSAAAFRPPGAMDRVAICATSSRLATENCERAGAAYTADLPASCVPQEGCPLHRGGVLASEEGRRARAERGQRKNVPENIFKSFRKFFGGN